MNQRVRKTFKQIHRREPNKRQRTNKFLSTSSLLPFPRRRFSTNKILSLSRRVSLVNELVKTANLREKEERIPF